MSESAIEPTPLAPVANDAGQQAQAAQTTTPPANGDTPSDNGTRQPDDGTDWKGEARKWESRSRQNFNDLKSLKDEFGAFKTAIGQALGIEQAPADPKELAAQLATSQQQASAARRESAVLRLAAANGANPDALTDSASFLRSVGQIDPDDIQALSEAIKKAVAAHPQYASGPAQAPGAGWRDVTAGGTTQSTDADAEALRILGF
ncbi:hypothetical protein GCM10009785_34870 [Brooklawnia cerclae]|uniref:Scaffolding protein n=1 Tax=Brooklawnia cerclae TaxID=349934 RepID=A0ABX0SNY8_9ACTN|nr:hypothetical protein [Brooklawnia cerclae]NIH58476.1 hypothetical protein [Brooklawnia cerclae]